MSKPIRTSSNLSLRPVTLAVLTALSVAPTLGYAATTPGAALDASDFLVNTYTPGNQTSADVARDAAGDFVVVWGSNNQVNSASNYDIYAQRYHADGSKNGAEFLVNTTTSDSQSSPTVAMDAAGDFVVAWESDNQAATSTQQIYFQRFNASGTPVGTETLVNSVKFSNEGGPQRIAMDAVGDFVLTWVDYTGIDGNADGVFARRYQADGTPVDPSEFQVNTTTSGNQTVPVVGMDAVGDFVVAWEDDSNSSIKARHFTLTGDTAANTEFQVSTNTFTNQYPYLGMDAQGDFVVGWEAHYTPSGTSVATYNVYARRYDKQDAALDPSDVEVYSDATTSAYVLGVALDAEGDYVVEIANYDGLDGNGAGLFGELFRADGTLVPPAVPVTGHPSMFQLDTTTSGNQQYPAGIAMDADGNFVAAWSDVSGNDTSGDGVYARRFAGPELTDLTTALTGPTASVTTGGSFSVIANVSNATASTGNTTIDANTALASGIGLSITIPSGATYKSASGTDWTCGSVSSGKLSCTYSGTLGAVAASDDLTLNFTAPSSTASLSFASSVSTTNQTDTASSNDNATASVGVTAASSGGGGSSSSSGGGGAMGLLSLLLTGLLGFARRRH